MARSIIFDLENENNVIKDNMEKLDILGTGHVTRQYFKGNIYVPDDLDIIEL